MTVCLAYLIDRFFGEPPVPLHPVVWIGHYLGWCSPVVRRVRPAAAFLLGASAWLVGAALFVGFFWYLEFFLLSRLPLLAALCLQALFLKPLLAMRLLLAEVRGVGESLELGLGQGRERLSRIVSRDTTQLSEGEVRESALESLSENLSDSLVAPLFWFLLLGLPGAALYRFSNTADAMWGYRGKWEWAGKWAALFDDVMSYVPSRLTALALWALARRPRFSLARLWREAARTPSPNSGWPMAAFALGLGLRLGKPGVYVLNAGAEVPGKIHFISGLRLAEQAALLVVILFSLLRYF